MAEIGPAERSMAFRALIAPALCAAGVEVHHVHRAVRNHMRSIAHKVRGREFPVAVGAPFLHAYQDHGAALAPVAMIEGGVEPPLEATEVVLERRGVFIPRRPYGAAVVDHVRDSNQTP